MAIYGTNGNDNLNGTELADISIFGYAGNDSINGKGGKDIIDAGEGNDIVNGGNDNDTILGRSGKDTLYGDSGNDAVFGEAGDDFMWGGEGIDSLFGGANNDTYLISTGTGDKTDTIVELAGAGTDKVLSYISYTLGANVENLQLLNSNSAYSGKGNSLDNEIVGNNYNNSLSGQEGADSIRGEGGNDWIDGGQGHDGLIGGAGKDSLFGGASDDALFGDEVFESFNTPTGNDYLSGGDGKDFLYGGGGNDTLTGGTNNDFLNGYSNSISGGEIDLLTGNAGADTFGLGSGQGSSTSIGYMGSGYAIITDFDRLEGDKIRVGGSINSYTLDKTSSIGGTAALDTLIYKANDLIAVVQDTTNVNAFLDFSSVANIISS